MNRYALRSGEYLAIASDAIKRDADGFFFMLGPSAPDSEAVGSVLVVHVRGALAHFKTGMGDSYEAIVDRVGAALARKPSSVVLRIESPGGVVSGLNESVLKLRKMSSESGIKLYAFVDEMAASAAYALCCACDERFAPPSAVVGSVGVISTMASQAKKDAKDGVEFVLITSGERKADGHPHAPISEDAVAAERGRVGELAAQFFALASDATELSPKRLAGLEANIFLGANAKKAGLIDDVMSWDALMALLDDGTMPLTGKETSSGEAPNEGNQTDRSESVDNDVGSVSLTKATSLRDESRTEDNMSVKLQALVAKMAAEKDPTKVIALLAEYGMLAKAEKPDDEGGNDDDKDDDKDDEGDSKSEKHAAKAAKLKAKAKATDLRSKAASKKSEAAALEEEAKKCEEEASGDEDDEEEEKKAAAASLARQALIAGGMSEGAAAALAAQAAMVPELTARLEKLEKCATSSAKADAIKVALADRKITPAEAKKLAAKDLSFVTDFLTMRPKAIVMADGEDDQVPDGAPGAHLGKETLAAIEEAVTSSNCTTPAESKALRESLMAAHIQAATARANGAAPRY